MPFDLTILKKKIADLKKNYDNGNFADALITALNTGNGLMQQRIFTDTKDTKGQTFGKYIGVKRKTRLKVSSNRTQNKRNKAIAGQFLTPYQQKRAKLGRQTAKKDLELYGGLRRAIETQIEDERAAVLAFNNGDAAKIAAGQEQQIENIRAGRPGTTKGSGATPIFKLNDQEKETVVEQGKINIIEILKG